jgi:DNA-binding CsgD family transcriptional regulator
MDGQPAATFIGDLTKREIDVLTLLAEGLSNQEIAQSLVMEVGTVKWYNTQIYDKLRVKNRQQAVTRARTLGILEVHPADPSQLCWLKCSAARIFRLKEDGVQWPPLFQSIGRKVSHAPFVAGLCQAWVESRVVEVCRMVAWVDQAGQSRSGGRDSGGCHTQQIGVDAGERLAAPAA